MKTKKIKTMDANDEKLCMIFQKFGYTRSVSKLMLYFMHNKNGISRDIEQTTGLRQPEVSTGICILRALNIVSVKEIEKKSRGKGRPTFEYTMKLSMKDLIKIISDRASKHILEIQKNIDDMNNLVKDIKFGEE